MNLINLITALTPGGIEAQEKAGQLHELERQTLPLDLSPTRSTWESLGFVFHEPVDDLFVSVTFPAGWTKRATDHSMWTYIVDAEGHKRGGIFYKAAYYDRSANASLNARFSVSKYAEHSATQLKTIVRDAFTQTESSFGIRDNTDFAIGDQHEAEAMNWLNEHYPDWRNPVAYWNELDQPTDPLS